jgi:aminoglycoside phosphotransferase (APT) family kinase protein
VSLLAHDRALPQRDVLLDAGAAGVVLARVLGQPFDGCAVARVTYRVGQSLRVLYRLHACGRTHLVAARTFAPGRDEEVYRAALDSATPTSPLAAVAWEPRLHTVLWTLPNERRLPLSTGLPTPPGLTSELVAYAPEKTATVRWTDRDGRPVAFAKLYADDAGARCFRLLSTLAPGLPVARARSYDPAARRLVVEPARGRSLASLRTDRLGAAYAAFGAALAMLHESPAAAPPFVRFEPERLRAATDSLALVRPDAAGIAGALVERLLQRRDASEDSVLLHGDTHAKNVLVDGAAATLIDLDQAARGDAAADLGGVLAALRTAARVGAMPSRLETSTARALLDGYARFRPLPAATTLRWHTAAALLVERALRSVARVRPEQLRRLPLLLADAESLLR